MALSGASNYKAETVEAEVEIKSNADKLFKLISNQHHDVPKASSANVHDVAVHEGDWETSGYVKLWKYTLVLQLWKDHMCWRTTKAIRSFSRSLQRVKEGLVKITLEYQRLNENDPPPHEYLRFLVNVIQDIDAYLLKE
ncbi:hypothetical protein ACE6H2_010452 [Prunus campanulata]